MRIRPDQLIEAARIVAGQSRDQNSTRLYRELSDIPFNNRLELDRRYVAAMEKRMGLVMESFLIGAAMTLKLLHGDGMPEPYEREYNHRERLRELLAKYELLAGGALPEPSSVTSSTQKIGE